MNFKRNRTKTDKTISNGEPRGTKLLSHVSLLKEIFIPFLSSLGRILLGHLPSIALVFFNQLVSVDIWSPSNDSVFFSADWEPNLCSLM